MPQWIGTTAATRSIAATEAYHEGIARWRAYDLGALRCINRAIAEDEGFALAYAFEESPKAKVLERYGERWPPVLVAWTTPDEHAGLASGVNNALARAGMLLSVAALPLVVGLGGTEYADPVAFDAAYRAALLICAALLAVGGLVAWLTIRNPEV